MQNISQDPLLVVESVLDLVGNTPMLKTHSIDTGLCDLYLKMESPESWAIHQGSNSHHND